MLLVFRATVRACGDAKLGRSAARVVLQNRPTETITEEVAIQWDESVSEDYSAMQGAAQRRGMSGGFRASGIVNKCNKNNESYVAERAGFEELQPMVVIMFWRCRESTAVQSPVKSLLAAIIQGISSLFWPETAQHSQ